MSATRVGERRIPIVPAEEYLVVTLWVPVPAPKWETLYEGGLTNGQIWAATIIFGLFLVLLVATLAVLVLE
jgi:hypothetical protein